MTLPRTATRCDQCGQVDDHPKCHPGGPNGPSKHHDCLSVSEREQYPSDSLAGNIIQTCIDGIRGDELLAHIEALHAEAV